MAQKLRKHLDSSSTRLLMQNAWERQVVNGKYCIEMEITTSEVDTKLKDLVIGNG